MPTAAQIAAVVLNPPPSGAYTCSFSEPSTLNREYLEIIPETLTPFSPGQIHEFRTWLNSVPFQFSEFTQNIKGRYMESEGDVRLFCEAGILLPCWPIVQAMVAAHNRDFDFALRSERTLVGSPKCRPDISVYQMCRHTVPPPEFDLRPLIFLEFKGLGGLGSNVVGPELLRVSNIDSWQTATSQLRKYVVCNGVSSLLVVDSEWAVYFQFEDPNDVRAWCQFLVAPVGPACEGFVPIMTARELFLFSVFNGLLSRSVPLRQITF